MDNLYILKEIAKFDRSVWKLFSLLNWEMNEYFCIKGYKYEICFREIEITERKICYKLDGLLHRTDGPAAVYENIRKDWYKNGKLHRLDGPAITYTNCKDWFVDGIRHRLDGPAIEFIKEDMKKHNQWYINGIRVKNKNGNIIIFTKNE